MSKILLVEQRSLMPKHTQFIRERQYLKNVSPCTVRWYTHAFKWLSSCDNPESPTAGELKSIVMLMRERGLKPTGCNAAIRAVNAYLHWTSGTDLNCGAGCTHPRMPKLKEATFVLPTFSEAQVRLLVRWKPRTFYERRLHLLIFILFDTGCRISEALSLRTSDCDFDNLLLKLRGKGDKERLVPMSLELRRALFRFVGNKHASDFVLSTSEGRGGNRCVALRMVKELCRELGFEPPIRTLHAFRQRSPEIICEKAAACSTSKKCLDIQRWR
jgi:integrase/recombinase XerD